MHFASVLQFILLFTITAVAAIPVPPSLTRLPLDDRDVDLLVWQQRHSKLKETSLRLGTYLVTTSDDIEDLQDREQYWDLLNSEEQEWVTASLGDIRALQGRNNRVWDVLDAMDIGNQSHEDIPPVEEQKEIVVDLRYVEQMLGRIQAGYGGLRRAVEARLRGMNH